MKNIKILESTYDSFLKVVFGIANPLKKTIIATQCKVHKYINVKALRVLCNDKHDHIFNFFNSFILDINKGAVWADQDFKSSNHFFNPYKGKGLYGRKSALELSREYYAKSFEHWHKGDFNKALFYFGAVLHIIQDMTIPQHANIKLLDNHRQYETYVKRTYQYINEFQADNGAYKLDTLDEYIRFNAKVAIKIYKRFKKIHNDEERYFRVTKCALPLAVKTTAGAMIMFYRQAIS